MCSVPSKGLYIHLSHKYLISTYTVGAILGFGMNNKDRVFVGAHIPGLIISL